MLAIDFFFPVVLFLVVVLAGSVFFLPALRRADALPAFLTLAGFRFVPEADFFAAPGAAFLAADFFAVFLAAFFADFLGAGLDFRAADFPAGLLADFFTGFADLPPFDLRVPDLAFAAIGLLRVSGLQQILPQPNRNSGVPVKTKVSDRRRRLN
ncbi:MAG: hypothetical protein H6839_14515 [Planctomycetes bacterium]|nr:hypothetical protein [Planctomycetota bacterium]